MTGTYTLPRVSPDTVYRLLDLYVDHRAAEHGPDRNYHAQVSTAIGAVLAYGITPHFGGVVVEAAAAVA